MMHPIIPQQGTARRAAPQQPAARHSTRKAAASRHGASALPPGVRTLRSVCAALVAGLKVQWKKNTKKGGPDHAHSR